MFAYHVSQLNFNCTVYHQTEELHMERDMAVADKLVKHLQKPMKENNATGPHEIAWNFT